MERGYDLHEGDLLVPRKPRKRLTTTSTPIFDPVKKEEEEEEEQEQEQEEPVFVLSEEESEEFMTNSYSAEFGQGYAAFQPDLDSEDGDDDSFELKLEDMDLKAQGEEVREKAKVDRLTKMSRILQGLPEAQLLEVLKKLQSEYGDGVLGTLQKQMEEIKNSQAAAPGDTEESDRWDWNTRFQEAILKVQVQTADTISDSDQMILWSFLAKTAGDFVQIATVYGKIIISEVYTPIAEKTIKPMHLGGTIGGDKYLVKKGMFIVIFIDI